MGWDRGFLSTPFVELKICLFFTCLLKQESGRKNLSINGPLSCISQIGLKSAEQSKFKVFSYLFDHSRSLLIDDGSNKRRIQINSLQLLSSRAEGPSVGGVPV